MKEGRPKRPPFSLSAARGQSIRGIGELSLIVQLVLQEFLSFFGPEGALHAHDEEKEAGGAQGQLHLGDTASSLIRFLRHSFHRG